MYFLLHFKMLGTESYFTQKIIAIFFLYQLLSITRNLKIILHEILVDLYLTVVAHLRVDILRF